MAARSFSPWCLSFLIVVLLSAASGTRAEVKAEDRTISVTGNATVEAVPDSASLFFSVHTNDADLAKAKTLNDEQMQIVLDLLKNSGIEDKDMQVSLVTSRQAFDYETSLRERKRVSRGYDVVKQVRVHFGKLDNFASVMDQLLKMPSVTILTHVFESTKEAELRDEARRKAVQAARAKADQLARQLGVQVGMPRTVTEPASDSPAQRVYALGASVRGAGGGPEDTTPIGQIAFEATVEVTYYMYGGQ